MVEFDVRDVDVVKTVDKGSGEFTGGGLGGLSPNCVDKGEFQVVGDDGFSGVLLDFGLGGGFSNCVETGESQGTVPFDF